MDEHDFEAAEQAKRALEMDEGNYEMLVCTDEDFRPRMEHSLVSAND